MTIDKFAEYTIKTLQYGQYEDVVNHSSLASLRTDLLNISHLQTIKILEIYHRGEPMPAARKRVMLAQSRVEAARVYKIKENY